MGFRNLENYTRYHAEYREKNREIIRQKNRDFRNDNPWMESFYKINQRCNNKNCKDYYRYGKRGIKALITKDEIKELYFRDKAYLMKQPTIDRINNDGNYEIGNCQWLENEENIRKSHPIVNVGQFDLNGNLIKIWNSQQEASKTLNYSQASISRSINHNRIAYGCKWRNLNAKS